MKIIPAAGANSPRKLNLNNIGTRIFSVSNLSHTGGAQSNQTFMSQVALEQHFDAVQLIFINNEASGNQIGDVSIGVSDGTDPVNPVAGSCIPVTFGGITPTAAAPITLPATTGTTINPDFYLSDIMPISSINRTDGGTLPLLHVRTYIPTTGTNVTLTTFGDSVNGSAFWGPSPPGGRTWRTRKAAGNLAVITAGSVPTWTDATERNGGVLCGVQYFARGSVVKVMFFGDSTSVGAGVIGPPGVAVTGAGAITRACHAVSDINSLAFQVASSGVSAQTMPEYYSRAVRMIPLFKPDIVIFTATQNSASITQAAVNATSYYTSLAQKLCKDNGALCILTTELAKNSADGVSAYTAGQDAFRQAYNTELMSRRNKGVLVVDSAGVISAGGLPAPNKAGYTCAGGHAHPNDLGYDAMSVPIAAELLRIKNANL